MDIRPVTAGLVDEDIAKVISAKAMDTKAVQYKVILHTPDDDIFIDNLVSIETSCDYANDITDYILVSMFTGLGVYIKRILLHMDNLEMTIIQSKYDKVRHTRYKALIVSADRNIAGTVYSALSETELNKMELITIDIQCVSRVVEATRLMTYDNIYRYSTVTTAIKNALANTIGKVSIGNETPDIAISMRPANNDQVFRHISIPAGVRVLDIPSYIQNTDYGVYSTDIGTYVQSYDTDNDITAAKETVFVYPLYSNVLHELPGKKLMVLSTPSTRLTDSDSTFLVDGDIVKIIAHGDSISKDAGQSLVMDSGNAAIVASTDNIMDTSSNITNDTVTADKNASITGTLLKNKDDGLNSTVYTRPTSNKYKVYSDIAKKLLSLHTITWKYSNPELLYPGMGVMYVYNDDTHGTIRLNGTLHSHFTKYSQASKTRVTVINILLDQYTEGINNNNSNTVDVRR